MAVQADILERIARRSPLSESLDAVVAAIEGALPGAICSILMVRNGETLHHAAGHRLPDAYRDAIDGLRLGPNVGSCGTAAALGTSVIAANINTDSRWADYRELALSHNLRSCWSTPIMAADSVTVLGTFAVYRHHPSTPHVDAVLLVDRFTHVAAIAIEHDRMFSALTESESRFRGAFEGALAGMALVSMNGRILMANEALAGMLGCRPDDLVGRAMMSCIAESHHEATTSGWRTLMRETQGSLEPGLRGQIEVPLVSEGSEPLWVLIAGVIIDPGVGQDTYFYLEVTDISAQRRSQAEQRAREVAEAASQAKTDFLARVSHELRTPLSAILGFAQLVEGETTSDELRQHGVNQITKSGERLLHLIDELLDLSRIESGHQAITIEQLAATALVGEVVDLLQPLAAARQIEIKTFAEDTDLGHPLLIRADRDATQQVLINVIGNALKYAPPAGRVEVNVRHAGNDMVRITIVDTGPGIHADEVERIFEPFARSRSVESLDVQGTGLGLAVTARLTKAMDGEIGVDSSSKGSAFWIELPAGVDRRSNPSGMINLR